MNRKIFCLLLLFAVVFVGCLDEFAGGNDQLKNRLAELEEEVIGGRDRIADAENRIMSELQNQRLDAMKQQLADANARNQRLESTITGRQPGKVGDSAIVPAIVWQICLSTILLVFTAITIKALLAFFKPGPAPGQTVYFSVHPGVEEMPNISELVKLLEHRKGGPS